MQPVTFLPTIGCNGYFFKPKHHTSAESYNLSHNMEPARCVISTFKEKVRSGNPQQVNPSLSKFKIDNDLQVMTEAEAYRVLSALAGFVSLVANAVLFGLKKNYKLSAAVSALSVGCAVGVWYFNRVCRRASFDIANKVISVSKNSDNLLYKPSDYNL